MHNLLILALTFSTESFACPTFEESYYCVFTEDSDNNVGDIEYQNFEQTTENGITVFSYNNGLIFRTDNKVYRTDYYQGDATVQASCNGTSTLNARLRWKKHWSNPNIKNLELNRTWKPLKDGRMLEKAVVTQINRGYFQKGTFYKECGPH